MYDRLFSKFNLFITNKNEKSHQTTKKSTKS